MTPPAPPLVRVRGATVGWSGTPVLRDVDLEIAPGDHVGLVGPNGAGKSTLLHAILGLAAPLRGTIERSPAWQAGYVPQREDVEPLLRLRAEEVVAMAAVPGAWAPWTAAARRAQAAREALAAVGMEDAARRVYRDLSGGQRQRVMLARALACEPTVLVLDEPTNGLDLRAEREILDLVAELRASRGLACLVVSHDLEAIAGEVASVGLIHDGEVRFGESREMLTPAVLTAVYGPGVRFPRVPGEETA